jgi:diguanylate cyclase (GGDEF)-like protein/MYXO-CTERM domain-containing protein
MVMNVQATHALPASGLPLLDRHRVNSPGPERAALAPVAATPHELRLAFTVVLLSVLAFAAALPFARVPLPRITAFIPSYESALAINDLVTAVLLFGRATRRGSRAYLALACGYLFNAAIIVPHVLSFPGVFSETGLLGANDQTTAWLYVFWHGGFPLFVLGYALLPEQDSAADFLHKHAGRVIGSATVGVIAIVAALTLLATVGHDLLPEIIRGGDYSLLISTGVSPTILGLSVLALLALWRRRERAVIDVWLMVVMSVWLLDVMLSSVVSSVRYDLGWYGGRSYGLLASCCLLIVLLFEMNRLYGRLADALATARTLQEHLTFRAENDSLTGLPNRALFYDRLETAMTRCRRTKKLMALLYLDIDHFKRINDNYGHAAGDDLLRLFSQRLLQCVRASDTVARLGGDEFTVILENLSSPDAAQSVVDKLIGALRHPYGTAEEDIPARASIGISYFCGEELNSDGLVKQADAALYRAKHGGRNRYWVYKPETASVL